MKGPMNSVGAHVAWTAFQRRQLSMADDAKFECIFLPITARGRVGKAFSYLQRLFETVKILRARKSRVVWVQLPQVPVLWAAFIYRGFFCREAKVVADCHNAMFRPPWSRFPFGLSLLSRCDVVLVHNEMVLDEATRLGVSVNNVYVLEDVPPVVELNDFLHEPECMRGRPRPWVVFPGSFAKDEPIEEVVEAAKLAPEMTFVITGKVQNAEKNGHTINAPPANLVTPGFLPVEEFDKLLRAGDVVLALTKIEGIQLSVCNEALGYGKPMAVSPTKILSRLFSESACVLQDNRPESICAGVRHVLDEKSLYAQKSRIHSARRRAKWVADQLSHVSLSLSK